MEDKENFNVCIEFITGCCLKEEFLTGELTERCVKVHSKTLMEDFKNLDKIDPIFLEDAIYTYETILNDVETKIINHKRMIASKIPDNITKIIDSVEELIESSNIDDFSSVYKLLKLHGELVSKAEKNEINNNFDVCDICAAFKKSDSECLHAFCGSYKKIRETLANCKNVKNKK